MHSFWPSLLPLRPDNDEDLKIVSAKGVRLEFANGQSILCGTSGLWNVNLGYGNKAIASAIGEKLVSTSYASTFHYWNEDVEEASARLRSAAGASKYERVLFSTSGSAAIDMVMKLSRQAQRILGNPAKTLMVGFRGGYHGLTYGAFSLSGEDLGQRRYGVDQRSVRHIGHNSIEELDRLFAGEGNKIACFFLEPVLGNGAHVVDPSFIARLYELSALYGFFIAADEVATGFGRTGEFFASNNWPEPPDILISSKGLTNGTAAASAVLVGPRLTAPFMKSGEIFVHGETQAGTPPSAVAIIATLDEFDRIDAINSGKRVSRLLDLGLSALFDQHDIVAAVRGVGCFRAVEVKACGNANGDQQIQLINCIRDAGALVHPSPSGFQILPALTFESEDVAELLRAIDAGLNAFATLNKQKPA